VKISIRMLHMVLLCASMLLGAPAFGMEMGFKKIETFENLRERFLGGLQGMAKDYSHYIPLYLENLFKWAEKPQKEKNLGWGQGDYNIFILDSKLFPVAPLALLQAIVASGYEKKLVHDTVKKLVTQLLEKDKNLHSVFETLFYAITDESIEPEAVETFLSIVFECDKFFELFFFEGPDEKKVTYAGTALHMPVQLLRRVILWQRDEQQKALKEAEKKGLDPECYPAVHLINAMLLSKLWLVIKLIGEQAAVDHIKLCETQDWHGMPPVHTTIFLLWQLNYIYLGDLARSSGDIITGSWKDILRQMYEYFAIYVYVPGVKNAPEAKSKEKLPMPLDVFYGKSEVIALEKAGIGGENTVTPIDFADALGVLSLRPLFEKFALKKDKPLADALKKNVDLLVTAELKKFEKKEKLTKKERGRSEQEWKKEQERAKVAKALEDALKNFSNSLEALAK